MEKKHDWKKIIAGVIIIFVVIWIGTIFFIQSIANLSTGLLATVIAFASVITYLVSKLL
jgi:hypothetical protein